VSHVIVKLFKDNALDGPRGNCGVSPQFMMYRRAYPESKMLKSKRGEAAYWLVGAAGVVLATWQFAVLVTN
jgi:hypothetical protein